MRDAHKRGMRTDRRGLRRVVAMLALLLAATGPLLVTMHGASGAHHHGDLVASYDRTSPSAPVVDPGHPDSGPVENCPICAHGQISQRTLVSGTGILLPTLLTVSRHESLHSETRVFGARPAAPESPRAPPLAS